MKETTSSRGRAETSARSKAGRPKGSGRGLTTKIQVCVQPGIYEAYETLGGRDWLRSILKEAYQRLSSSPESEGWVKAYWSLGENAASAASAANATNPTNSSTPTNTSAAYRGVSSVESHLTSPTWVKDFRIPTPLMSLPAFPTSVQCGFPSPAADYATEELDLNSHLIPHPASTFVAVASGLSMTGAGIDPGDYLIVDRALEVRNNDIVLAFIDGEFTVKRYVLERATGKVSFHPENDDFPIIEVNEFSDVMVYGVVTSVIKSLR